MSNESLFKYDFSLRDYNTFGVDVKARQFLVINHEEQYRRVLEEADDIPWVLGGGSNLLLTGDLDYTVMQNGIMGIEIVDTHEDHVTVRIGGGEVWHDLVKWAVENDLGGLENLSLIPGRVGASPIQNIGAYGVELKDCFVELEAIHLESGEIKKYFYDDCEFGYRDSIFKRDLKGQLCISRVTLRLTNADHKINTDYGAIRKTLEAKGIKAPSIRDVSAAVIEIRSSKLPDPKEIGNSGSFFKNPVVPVSLKDKILKDWPDLVYYPVDDETAKIPAGWLIDRCGWKGSRVGNVGCYKNQALVIVNYGGATGKEIFDFAMKVRASVAKEFGITLTPEVNII